MTKEIQAKDAEMQVGGRSNFDETRNLTKKGSSCLCSTFGGRIIFLVVVSCTNPFIYVMFRQACGVATCYYSLICRCNAVCNRSLRVEYQFG